MFVGWIPATCPIFPRKGTDDKYLYGVHMGLREHLYGLVQYYLVVKLCRLLTQFFFATGVYGNNFHKRGEVL